MLNSSEMVNALISTQKLAAVEKRRLCLCEKLISSLDCLTMRYSGIVNFEECLCPSCTAEFSQFTRVVCLGCKSLAALQKPGKVKTGFEFKRGGCVHVANCPNCKDGLIALPVLEHLRFCLERGIPTEADKDIVQEVEQKDLQALRDTDKLRESIQP